MGGVKSKELPRPSEFGSAEEAMMAYYEAKILPVERRHLYADFYSPPIDKAELTAIPSLLLLGEHGVGKTSLITYLLKNQAYRDTNYGPGPTHDIVFVKHGADPPTFIPGPALVSETDFPFRGLTKFGHELQGHIKGATLSAALLKDFMFVDTPGILAKGDQKRLARSHEYHEIIRFLADKVDRIWLLFDTTKMEICDEFKLIIHRLEDNVDKVRIILNKADAVPAEELVRVRGMLMWNLGKILTTPEIPHVHLGSFWPEPLKIRELKAVFLRDYLALITDLKSLHNTSLARKLDDVVQRAKKVQVHALIMNRILVERGFCGCSNNASIHHWTVNVYRMRKLYYHVQVRDKVPIPYSDFPHPEEFIEASKHSVWSLWDKIYPQEMKNLASFLKTDATDILAFVHKQLDQRTQGSEGSGEGERGESPGNTSAGNTAFTKKSKKKLEAFGGPVDAFPFSQISTTFQPTTPASVAINTTQRGETKDQSSLDPAATGSGSGSGESGDQ